MYRVLIVEDELPVRNTIIESIDWKAIGFEVAFAAGDGQEALDFLEGQQVDLIMTDIYMPFIDGLELVRRLRARKNKTKVVFLTGFNEFDYAKEAIELDASRYLLKPITKDEMVAVLTELRDEIHLEISTQKNVERLQLEYEKRQQYLKEKLINDILTGYMPMDRITSAAEYLGCQLEAEAYTVGVLEVVNKEEVGTSLWNDDYSLLHFAIYNICKEIANKEDKVILGEQGRVILLFRLIDRESDYQSAFDVLEQAIFNIKQIYDMNMSAGLGSIYESLSYSNAAYKEALLALEYKILEGVNRVIVITDVERKSKTDYNQIDTYMTQIETAIRVGDLEGVLKYLAVFFDSLKFHKSSMNEFKTYTLTLMTKIYGSYNQIVLSDQDQFAVESSVIEKILNFERIDQIKDTIGSACRHMSEEIQKIRDDDQIAIVQDARKYIEANYAEADLDVNKICTQLHVSSSYFGRLFKKHNHQTFVEYLTNFRLDQAKSLLKNSSMKVFEIAEKVGYEDPHYFSYNFRKNIGMTPLQYRKG